jgi:membrane protease YdiL (CAAX protease family)
MLFAANFFFYVPCGAFGVLLDGFFFLALVLIIARRRGKDYLPRLLTFRPLPLPVFCSLLIMYLGFEIIATEILNIFNILLPAPVDFFESRQFDNVFLIIVFYAVLPALTEELLFRGIILNRLCVKRAEWKAIVISSLLFGLIHLNPWQFINATIGGFFYGWIYRRYRNLWLTIFLHCYYNILVNFMIIPCEIVPNMKGFEILVIHPLWFDVMGFVLFALGMALVLGNTHQKIQKPGKTERVFRTNIPME